MDKYEEKLDREKRWHTADAFRHDHVLNSRLLYSEERNLWNYEFPKERMAQVLRSELARRGVANPTILVAPIGDGQDLRFLEGISEQIVGIDISPVAVESLPETVEAHVGDMKRMPFEEGAFDVVVTPLFFHHFRDEFVPFLVEIYRVLRPGGVFLTLEPSILHPVSWVTRSARALIGNITGQVEDEGPLLPSRLTKAIICSGFTEVRIQGASFTHNRVPRALGRIINRTTRVLLTVPGIKQAAWMCIWTAVKPRAE